MSLKRVAAVMLLVAVVLAGSGTAGFSAATADRGVAVNVVDDEYAYLALDWKPLDRCGNQPLVEITNRFETELTDIDVEVTDTDRLEATIRNNPDRLGPDKSSTVDIKLNPRKANQTDDRWVKFRVDAHGQSVEVNELRRQVRVTNCPTRGNTRNTPQGSGS